MNRQKNEGNLTPIAVLKLETSLFIRSKDVFHYLHSKKYEKSLFRKGNEFWCLKLILSAGFVLEAGIYSVK